MSHIISHFLSIERIQSWANLFTAIAQESAIIASRQTCNEAKKKENQLLNRYEDVLPFDSTLVRLDDFKTKYINANYVRYEPAKRSYILTQGPLPHTMSHFWQMVWQERCNSIIMLNRLVEKGRTKCSRYYPIECSVEDIIFDGMVDSDTTLLTLDDSTLSLELKSEIHYKSFVKRNIRVINSNTGEARDVCHYNYTDWPDFGEPSCALTFLNFLNLLRNEQVFDGQPVVHCSAGIGRSGTFIFVDIVLQMLACSDYKTVCSLRPIDILQTVRSQRIGLIQTPEQLRFCYLAITQAFGDPFARIHVRCIGDFIAYLSVHANLNDRARSRKADKVELAESGSSCDDDPLVGKRAEKTGTSHVRLARQEGRVSTVTTDSSGSAQPGAKIVAKIEITDVDRLHSYHSSSNPEVNNSCATEFTQANATPDSGLERTDGFSIEVDGVLRDLLGKCEEEHHYCLSVSRELRLKVVVVGKTVGSLQILNGQGCDEVARGGGNGQLSTSEDESSAEDMAPASRYADLLEQDYIVTADDAECSDSSSNWIQSEYSSSASSHCPSPKADPN